MVGQLPELETAEKRLVQLDVVLYEEASKLFGTKTIRSKHSFSSRRQVQIRIV